MKKQIKNYARWILFGILVLFFLGKMFHSLNQSMKLRLNKIETEYQIYIQQYKDSIEHLNMRYELLEQKKDSLIIYRDTIIEKIKYVKLDYEKAIIDVNSNSCSDNLRIFTEHCDNFE